MAWNLYEQFLVAVTFTDRILLDMLMQPEDPDQGSRQQAEAWPGRRITKSKSWV